MAYKLARVAPARMDRGDELGGVLARLLAVRRGGVLELGVVRSTPWDARAGTVRLAQRDRHDLLHELLIALADARVVAAEVRRARAGARVRVARDARAARIGRGRAAGAVFAFAAARTGHEQTGRLVLGRARLRRIELGGLAVLRVDHRAPDHVV